MAKCSYEFYLIMEVMATYLLNGKTLIFYVRHGECDHMKGWDLWFWRVKRGILRMAASSCLFHIQTQVNVTKTTTTQAIKSDR